MTLAGAKRQGRTPWRGRAWALIKALLALGLVGALAAQISLADTLALWHRLDLLWACGATLSFVITIVLTALRYRLLLDGAIPLRASLRLVIIQTVTGNIVASSAGLASYFALLLGRYQIPLARSVLAYIWSRCGDLAVMLVCLIGTGIVLRAAIAPVLGLVIALAAGVTSLLCGFGLVVIFRQHVVRLLRLAAEALRLQRFGIVQRIMAQCELLASQDAQRTAQLIVPWLALSALLLVAQLLYVYCALAMFGLRIELSVVLFVLLINLFISIIPIQIFGGLGIVEITSINVYALFGIGSAALTPVLLNMRLAFYMLNILLLLYFPFEPHSAREQLPSVTHEG